MRNGWSNCFLIVLYASPCVVLVGLIYLERLKMAEPSLVLSIRNIQVRKQISTPESAFASPIKKGKTGGPVRNHQQQKQSYKQRIFTEII